MTLNEVIEYVDDIKPNAFSDGTKTQWINEVEGLVQTEIMLIDIQDIQQYNFRNDADTTLLVRPPHSKIYGAYLTAMIDYANGEYNKYNNTMELFNSFLIEYTRWYAQKYRPADGGMVTNGYYITAYGIACAHGYTGTEEEWLASLQGVSPTVAVGQVTTGPAGSSASVTNVGTPDAAVFDFVIPKGVDGTGAGDMQAAIYDPTSKAQDVFAYAETAAQTLANRSTAASTANTGYTTLMFRGESLHASPTAPAVNGAIAWQYE